MQVLKDVVVLAGILTWQLGLFFFRPTGKYLLSLRPPPFFLGDDVVLKLTIYVLV
jgi:hypothetical protein